LILNEKNLEFFVRNLNDLNDIRAIDDMPFLKQRLGKAGCDRIRAVDVRYKRPKGRKVENPVQDDMLKLLRLPDPLFDILYGIGSAMCTSGSLDTRRMFVLLQSLDFFETRRVQSITDLSEAHAAKYVRLARLSMPHIEKYFRDNPISFDSHLTQL
jgi:hypothetical protein